MTNCSICSGQNFKKSYDDKKYQVIQCKDCGFGFLKNSLLPKDLKKLYCQDYFDDKRTSDYVSDADYKFKFIKRYLNTESKVLDFGCGIGDFIRICKKNNIQIYGFDLSKYACRFVTKNFGITTFSSAELLKNKGKYFDIVVSFDVIEHISDFDKILELLHSCLKPGGHLFFTTPNINSWDAKILKQYWYGYKKFPQHINYFSPQSIKMILKSKGFSSVEIRQWGFVRDFDFVFSRYSDNKNCAFKILSLIGKITGLDKKKVFFPLVDMMVVAVKT